MIETILNEDIDIEAGSFWFFGEVNDFLVHRAIKRLYVLDACTCDSITMHLSSNGGDVVQALALIDMIQLIDKPVGVCAYGPCLSVATTIVACCAKGRRVAMPSTQFMVHNWTAEVSGTQSELIAIMEENNRLGDQILQKLSENSNLSFDEWVDLESSLSDCYFTAEEAVRKGIIDHVAS